MAFRKNWKIKSFNSRPRKEVDIKEGEQMAKRLIFQLTTSQGGRPAAVPASSPSPVFQLTTSQGGRLYTRFWPMVSPYFNSRPRKEVDGVVNVVLPSFVLFQLTTSQGGRLSIAADSLIPISTHDLARRSTAIFTQKVFLSKSLFVLIAYNIFILY